MVDSCGSKCLKYSLFFSNIAFFISGIFLAALSGVAAFSTSGELHEFVAKADSPLLMDGLYILFAVGLALIVISSIGCLGAIRESKCLLITYFSLILILFIIELTGVIIILVKLKAIEGYLIDALKVNDTGMTATQKDAITYIREGLEKVEKKYHCCGITGPQNYNTGEVPMQCMHNVTSIELENGKNVTVVTDEPFKEGCLAPIRPYLYAAGGVAIGIMVLQVMIMLFTCCLISEIKKDYVPV